MVGNWDQEPSVLVVLKTSLLPVFAVVLRVSGAPLYLLSSLLLAPF